MCGIISAIFIGWLILMAIEIIVPILILLLQFVGVLLLVVIAYIFRAPIEEKKVEQ